MNIDAFIELKAYLCHIIQNDLCLFLYRYRNVIRQRGTGDEGYGIANPAPIDD